MLTFFPKPYPDELLYSIIARYHVWSGNDEMSYTMEQLFNNRSERATILIPKHLHRLAKKTSEFGLDYETLLYEHTIFPFASCFNNKASFDIILDTINNIDQKEKSLSLYKSNLNPKYLRYCPLCISDDRYNFGEAYWHRKHHLNGIELCDKHGCRLKESGIEVSDHRNNRFIALELMNDITDAFEKEDISECSIEMQVAYDVDYIYKNYKYIKNLLWEKHNLIRETTIALLFKRDLASKKGLVKISRLKQEFKDRYVSTRLKQLVVDLDNNCKADWLVFLCREGRKPAVPIRFILFADYLAGSLESYLKLISEQEQFIDIKKEMYQPPIGYDEKLAQYRRRWLDAREKHPNGCRFDLIRADNPAYTWLNRHDNEWMLNNSPPIKKRKGKVVFKDWDKIDKELESLVADVVYRIKNLGGQPERITKTNICRYMRQNILYKRYYTLLPRTMYKIEHYVENTYDYRLRKIEWAKREIEKEGKPSAPWRVLEKAGIDHKEWNNFKCLITS